MNKIPTTPERLSYRPSDSGAPDSPALAWRELSDGSFVVFTGIIVDRFVVDTAPPHSSGAGLEEASAEVRRTWRAVVAALAHLVPSREFWHIITTRQHRDAGDGAVMVGWAAVGRGPTRGDAIAASLAAHEDLRVILAAHYDFFTVRSVSEPAALAHLLRTATEGSGMALRRRRWEPTIQVEASPSAEAGDALVPGSLLPWPGQSAPWAPMLEGMASLPAAVAFVVRCETGVRVPREAVARAEADLLSVNRASLHVLSRDVEDATPVPSAMEALAAAVGHRLQLLEGPCLLADAILVGAEPLPPGLAATLAATLATLPDGSDAARGRPQAVEVLPVAFVTLDSNAIWMPLDPIAHPELLVSPSEAVTLVRTPEPPGDERSPLPCARARVLPLRSVPMDGTLLGDGEVRGDARPVRLPDAVRLQHVYIVGQTGAGKSTLMLNMALGDIAAGHGLTLLDPHGSLISAVLERIPERRRDDVIVVDPSDLDRHVGLNLLDLGTTDPAHYVARRDSAIDELFDTFEALYDMRVAGGPMFEQYFRVFLALVMGAVPPLDYVPLLPMLTEVMNDRELAKALAARVAVSDPITEGTLRAMFDAKGEAELRNITPYIVSKLNRFYGPVAGRRMLCQVKGIDFAEVIASRRIVLVNLPAVRLGGDTAALIARQIIARLANEAMRRGTDADAPLHFVYADEFHQFATERFAALLAEARKFRLGLVLGHQYTSQLVHKQDRRVLDAVLGNVGTVIAFRVGAQDAELLDDVMAPRATASDISGLPNHVAVVRSVGALGNVPFTLRTRPPSPVGQSFEVDILERSRQRHGRPTEEVDLELGQQLEALRAVRRPAE